VQLPQYYGHSIYSLAGQAVIADNNRQPWGSLSLGVKHELRLTAMPPCKWTVRVSAAHARQHRSHYDRHLLSGLKKSNDKFNWPRRAKNKPDEKKLTRLIFSIFVRPGNNSIRREHQDDKERIKDPVFMLTYHCF